MTPSPTATLRQSLPIALFERLWALVQQFPQAIAAPALVLSEVELSVPVDCSIDRFVVVVSAPFSVLLTAVITADTAAVDLQFEPLAIASFNSGQGNLSKNLDTVFSATGGQNRNFWTLTANKGMLQGGAGKQFNSENIKYVPKFFAAAIIGENPQDFGVSLQPLSTYAK